MVVLCDEGGLGALLAFRATTTVHRGEAVIPEFRVEEEVVSGVAVEVAEVVSIVEEEGNGAVSEVEGGGSEVVSVAEVVERHGVGVVVKDDPADLDEVLNRVGSRALREVELGGSVDEDLSVRGEDFRACDASVRGDDLRACDAFVGGCSAGDTDSADTRVDISLESADTESARDFNRLSVSC